MPIYEYRCADCKRRVSIFFRSFSDTNASPACPNCGGTQLARLVSRVAALKSEDARLEAMSDPSSFGDVDENDPKSMARFMRKMGDQMGGEDLGPEFGEMVDRLEAGENPEEIEKSMPGLGGEGAGDMGGMGGDDF
ncbi:MAG: zinc ribbon domain-containing protein [Chloroflexota bacterium]|nr:zinc ribbon domain-containing protein [Chloroflexota bacterium]